MLFILTVGILAVGCAEGPAVKPTVPVSGKITFNGQPVVGAMVSFSPTVNEKGVYPALAMTNEEGVYDLHTPFGGDVDNPGAVEGEYNVTIVKGKSGNTDESGAAASPEDMAKRMGAANKDRPRQQNAAGPKKYAAAPGMLQSDSEIPVRYSSSALTPLRLAIPGGDYDFELTEK